MSNLVGVVGELNITIQITRKETGKVEEFKLTGFLDEDQLKGLQNGSNTLNGSEKCGN